MQRSSVILPGEAEGFTQAIQKFTITKIGCKKWFQQHEYIEKLNQQAVMSAAAMEDEFVKEFLISYDKIPTLIHELILVEIWKEKVFPKFIDLDLQQTVVFPIYMVLYHEATLVNLLETVMYHQESCESAGDYVLDLVDYCYRKLAMLVASIDDTQEEEQLDSSSDPAAQLQNASSASTLEELEKQNKKLNFDICVKSLSILRYICDHLTSLPLSASSRVLNTHDFPLLLVELICSPPWTKESDGKLRKYVDNAWQTIPHNSRFQLTKIEGQVWIALFHLLMDPECQRQYEISSTRKNIIIRLRAHITDVVVDQMPILGEMKGYLERLSFMDPPAASGNTLLLEQIPEIQENILQENKGKWGKIAKTQSETLFNPNKSDMREQAARLAETYSLDVLESLITEPPKCATCGAEAVKRCSRCQNEWYCRRECQVGHWKKHKQACDLLVNSQKKIEENSTMTASS